MKKGWEIKKLSEVGKIFNGNSINEKVKKDKYTNLEDGYPFIATKDIGFDSSVNYENGVKIPFSEKLNFKIAPPNTTLICAEGGSAGKKIGIINKEVCFGNKLFALIPNKNIDSKFIYYYYFSHSFKEHFNDEISGLIGGVSMNKFKDICINVPPLSEQKEIVSILDDVFQSIERAKSNAEQNLKNAKELFESYLTNIFRNNEDGWVTTTIGEVCILQTGGTPSTSNKEYYEGGDIKWLVSGDINQKEIYDCEGRITQVGMNNSNTKILPVNSVLIALNGQGKTRGTVAMLRTKATCNQSLVSIFPKNERELLPELVFSNLEGRYEEIRKMTGDSGNDRRGLNMPLIRGIKFSYPKSISIQKEVICKLDLLRKETSKLESIYKNKLNDLEELKKSILQKAFNGELKTSKISA